jgi:acetyltransferase-like isoleucine patch superfamily enzyme
MMRSTDSVSLLLLLVWVVVCLLLVPSRCSGFDRDGDFYIVVEHKCASFYEKNRTFELITAIPDDVTHNSPRRQGTISGGSGFDILLSISPTGDCHNDEHVYLKDKDYGEIIIHSLGTDHRTGYSLTMHAPKSRNSTLILQGSNTGIVYDEMVVEVKEKFVISPEIHFVINGPHSWFADQHVNVNITVGRGSYPRDPSLLRYLGLLDELDWKITIGKFCSIAPFDFLAVQTASHQYTRPSTYPFQFFTNIHKAEPIQRERHLRIGNDVWIGEQVTFVNSVTIGDGAVIGARSVVRGNIPPYAIAVGNPAQVVKYRLKEENIEKMAQLKWWDWSDEDILSRLRDGVSTDEFAEKYYSMIK